MALPIPFALVNAKSQHVIAPEQVTGGRIVSEIDQLSAEREFPASALYLLSPGIQIIDQTLELDLTH